jgi:hypothetical protein
MKLRRICSALLALILLACLSGVDGQYSTPTSGYSAAAPSASQNNAQYSQYYTMNTGPAPNIHISVPLQYNNTGNMPTTVYFSNQMQPIPFSMYKSSPTYSENDSLWIKGATDWSQYAAVPVGQTYRFWRSLPQEAGDSQLSRC